MNKDGSWVHYAGGPWPRVVAVDSWFGEASQEIFFRWQD